MNPTVNRVADWITAREEKRRVQLIVVTGGHDHLVGRPGQCLQVSSNGSHWCVIPYVCVTWTSAAQRCTTAEIAPLRSQSERCEEEIGAASRCRCLVSGEQCPNANRVQCESAGFAGSATANNKVISEGYSASRDSPVTAIIIFTAWAIRRGHFNYLIFTRFILVH